MIQYGLFLSASIPCPFESCVSALALTVLDNLSLLPSYATARHDVDWGWGESPVKAVKKDTKIPDCSGNPMCQPYLKMHQWNKMPICSDIG